MAIVRTAQLAMSKPLAIVARARLMGRKQRQVVGGSIGPEKEIARHDVERATESFHGTERDALHAIPAEVADGGTAESRTEGKFVLGIAGLLHQLEKADSDRHTGLPGSRQGIGQGVWPDGLRGPP